MKRFIMTVAIAVACGIPVAARGQDAPVDSLALARQYTQWLYAGEVDSLLAYTTDEVRPQMTEGETFARLNQMIVQRAGFELEVSEETWKLRNGDCQYWRTAQFSQMEEPLLLRWVLDPRGRIEGIGAGPLTQAPEVESETCGPAPS